MKLTLNDKIEMVSWVRDMLEAARAEGKDLDEIIERVNKDIAAMHRRFEQGRNANG